MKQVNRIPGGRCVDYDTGLAFTFNGRAYQGLKGDTLASALLANGVDVLARSFKYGRQRGIVAAGAEEPNAILQVGAVHNTSHNTANDKQATWSPNVRATQQLLFDGLVCRSLSGGWSLAGLAGRLFSRLMPPGFYYKTFMFPGFMWRFYEYFMRRAAGLGTAPAVSDPDIYDHLNHHCDLLIVGAGPAGLAAALAAGKSGARLLVLDDQAQMGGCLLHSNSKINGLDASAWLAQTIAALTRLDNVVLLPMTTAVGYHDHNFIVAHERRAASLPASNQPRLSRERLHRIRARQVVLATGAQERPLVFSNNDLPGCMQASAVSIYIHRYGVLPGRRLVLMTTNDHGYQAALDWHSACATGQGSVVAIVDTRPATDTPVNTPLVQAARSAGIRIITGSAVIEATGSGRVTGVKVAAIDALGRSVTGKVETIRCDTLASSGGWSPVVHLTCHTGTRPIWRDEYGCFVPGKTIQAQHCAGAITGLMTLSSALAQGAEAGRVAAGLTGHVAGASDIPQTEAITEAPPIQLFHVPHTKSTSRAPKQFVDFQLDVSAADIELATREGFTSIEHVKRYTALGFGTDQGKLGNVAGVAIAARALGQSIAATGTTMFRPNYTPISFGSVAGRVCGELFDPIRYTAIQPWHEQQGARFENVGQWWRPWYYPRPGESMQDSLHRECLAVRQRVGILDASTLGKIDIQGPDAREFLNRVYTNAWLKLPVGQCRYGLMCGEDGMVIDDGVTAALGDNHFLMHTTTGGAAQILEWLELWQQTEWPELEVYFNSVTDQWTTAAITGPRSRDLLQGLTDIDLSGFPFMHWRAGKVAGIPARVFRVSFTGELTYEVNVQANYGLRLWQTLVTQGEPYGITAYGTETMHILRAEKGFVIVGQDTDGSVTPDDLGMGWAVAKQKRFSALGKRGMAREDCQRTGRKQLVGLLPLNPEEVLQEGAQLVADPAQSAMAGHVTSSYYSATLGRSFALALVQDGRKRVGETIYSPGVKAVSAAKICAPVFYDPEGERQNIELNQVVTSDLPVMQHLTMNHLPDSPEAGHSPLAQADNSPPDKGGWGVNTSPDRQTVTITEQAMLGHLVIRGQHDGLAQAVQDLLGLPLPSAPLQSCETQATVLRWVSPDEWLLTLPGENLATVEAGLRERLDERFAIVDVSGGQTMLHLAGENADLVVRKSTSYDINPANFPEGKTVTTLFARTPLMLRRMSPNAFELIIRRSFTHYIHHWLQDAAGEYDWGQDQVPGR